MELTQKEKKLISRAGKSFRFSLVLGTLMIVVPILFTFYIKAAPMERMEKVFPGLVEMRNVVERDVKYFETYKGKVKNQREIDLIKTGIQLKVGVLEQAYFVHSAAIILFMNFCQSIGFLSILWAFDKRRLVRIIKKNIV